jgi:hypothetical protein
VADTNVLVSAVLQPAGAPGCILRAWRDGEIELVVCPALLRELGDVLARPRLQSRLIAGEARALVALIREQAELRADPVVEPGLTRDPNDDFIVALAQRTQAGCIVSGDRDLLGQVDLRPPVLSPARFCDLLARGDL